MTPTPPPVPAVIIEQASVWLVALREPHVSAEVRRAFADWLTASPVHIRAYLEVVALWTDLADVEKDLPIGGVDELADDANPQSSVVSFPLAGERARSVPAYPGVRRTWKRAWGVAAAVFAVMFGWLTWQLSRDTFSAAVGEQRVLTLDDGSVVTLNSRATIKVRFSKPRREIELVRGQAFFQVAKDAARPFIVRSGTAAVRAVGTEFDVFHKTGGTRVAVVEGRVEVNASKDLEARAPPASPTSHSPREANIRTDSSAPNPGSEQNSAMERAGIELLLPGQQLTLMESGSVKRDDHADIAATTSWLHHELVFDGASLGDVVEELNQYSRKPIVVTDPVLAATHISAIFHSTKPDSFLLYMKHLSGVEVQESTNEIRINRIPARNGS